MKEKIKIGVVGVGVVGRIRSKAIANEIKGADLAAVCDIDPAALDWAREEFGDEDVARCGSMEELLGKVDAVFVATPHDSHPTLAAQAFDYPADYDRFAENLGAAVDYAQAHGVTLAYHPHRGCIVETIAETQMMIDRLPGLKLCIDTAHLAAAGEHAGKFAETFADRIVHTHIKDYDEQSRQFRAPGEGNSPLCPLPKVLQTLEANGYDGPLCLELDGGEPLEEPAAKIAARSLDYIKQHLSRL